MYLQAMREVGSTTSPIEGLVKDISRGMRWQHALEKNQYSFGDQIASETYGFVRKSLEIASQGKTHEVISFFLFGREDPIPAMFNKMVETIERERILANYFKLYLQRHIEIDGNDHGPMAEKLLINVCGDDAKKWKDVEISAVEAIEQRIRLWDGVRNQFNLQQQPMKLISYPNVVSSEAFASCEQ